MLVLNALILLAVHSATLQASLVAFQSRAPSVSPKNSTKIRMTHDDLDENNLFELDSNGNIWRSQLLYRPRRLRLSQARRDLYRETSFSLSNLVYPIFVTDNNKQEDEPVDENLPDLKVLAIAGLMEEIEQCSKLGLKSFMLFPKVSPNLKSRSGEEASNPEGIIPTAIKKIKTKFPNLVIFSDVALDPYTPTGHDGIVAESNPQEVINDTTLYSLCQQAITQARCGVDFVCPSDMMDGRVGAIREALDEEGFGDTGILSYSAKYSSSLYGPFRAALGTTINTDKNKYYEAPDKKTYQMDPANVREAVKEAKLDADEGADILMVKPGLMYQDVLKSIKYELPNIPLAAYQVSGEYAMLRMAAKYEYINEKDAVQESIMSLKRAGANLIVTYYAKKLAQWAHSQ